MGPDITFCPVIAAQLKPNEHSENARTGQRVPEILNKASLKNISWVFELDDDGTVIYSRPHISTGIEGHNFFEEELGFVDIDKCRQHFRSFINSHKAAEKFRWRCTCDAGTIDTNVLMTRGFQTGDCDPTGVVMMEIRSD